MNENDAFYNALIDVAAWDKENTAPGRRINS